MKKLASIVAAVSILSLASCAEQHMGPTGDYNESEVGKLKKVVPGVIVSERKVNIYNRPSKAQNAVSSSEPGADVTRKTGYEYVIKLDTGSIVSVVQTENLNLEPKQHILVIYGKTTRVVADEGITEE